MPNILNLNLSSLHHRDRRGPLGVSAAQPAAGRDFNKLLRRNVKPTGTQHADRRRQILITDECTMTFRKWRHKGESFRPRRVDRCSLRRIEGRCLYQIMSAKTKVTKTKTALKQETYNLTDLNEA